MQLMNDESATRDSSRPSDDIHLNPDLELQPVDPKTQERSKFLTSSSSQNHPARHWGNNCVFCFRRNEPIFTLGPHCKYNLIDYLK